MNVSCGITLPEYINPAGNTGKIQKGIQALSKELSAIKLIVISEIYSKRSMCYQTFMERFIIYRGSVTPLKNHYTSSDSFNPPTRNYTFQIHFR